MNALLIAQATLDQGAIDLAPSIGRTFVALLVVVALIAGLAWLLRRTVLGRRPGGLFAVESSVALGERRSLVVVTVEGRRLLLGLAPNAVSLLTELQAPVSFEAAVERATAGDGRS